MTRVTLLRGGGRRSLAGRIGQAWGDARAVWVLDPSMSATGLTALATGILDDAVVREVTRSGRAEVDLPVPAGTATIVTSSGTTATPKVVCLSAAAMDASARGAHAHLGVGEDDRWGLALPLHHVAGQSVLWRSRVLGSPPLVQDRLDARTANRAGVTVMSLVPTQLRRLVDAGAHLDARVLLGGGAIAPSLVAAATDHVGGVTRSYGLTETAGGCVYDGVPFPGVEVTVRNGELGLRGPVLASGRLTSAGMASITDAAGWVWTNDLGSVTDGVVSVVGRADDVVITGGVNVDPASVEVVLEDHPAVLRAGVVGLDDDEWGQRLVAALVLQSGPHHAGPGTLPADTPLVHALRESVRAQVGAAAVPRTFVAVADLPLTGLGKVRRARLREVLTTS